MHARRAIVVNLVLGIVLALSESSGYSTELTAEHGPPSPIGNGIVTSAPLVDTTIVLPIVEFRSTPLREALEALTRPHGIDVWIDPAVTGTVGIRLTDISLNDALLFLIDNYQLAYKAVHGVIRITPVPVAEPLPPKIAFSEQGLTVDAESVPVIELARHLTEATSLNVVVDAGVTGLLTGHLKDAEFEGGLRALLESNGFVLDEADDIYRISRPMEQPSEGGPRRKLSVKCDEGMVALSVADAGLRDVIENIAARCGLQLFIYGTIEGTVSAVCSGLDAETVFGNVLNGTVYTYKVEDGVFLVGDKTIGEINTSELVVFQHMVAKDLVDVVPANLAQHVTIKAIVEQNALMLSGPYGAVREVTRYLRPLDVPPAQILIEALVVDYATTESSEFSITAGLLGGGDSLAGRESYFPSLDVERSGPEIQHGVDEWASHLGISGAVGRLSDDFFIRLRALEEEGVANIRSRPQIAALNGHKASIHIGTTQYYLLNSETVYSSGQPTVSTQVSQRFETIDADISFEVTPWVTGSGEVIVEIRPEFKTPQGAFDPDVPPTINRRLLESTVRLMDGETIVLGGLIQTGKTQSVQKFPILGDIPILGRLFQNRRTVASKSELVIYLTPHVYYGSDAAVDPTTIGEP